MCDDAKLRRISNGTAKIDLSFDKGSKAVKHPGIFFSHLDDGCYYYGFGAYFLLD